MNRECHSLVVAQLAERLLPTQKGQGSKPELSHYQHQRKQKEIVGFKVR